MFQVLFGQVDLVESTICAYTGGTTADPWYYSKGDHRECVFVTYRGGIDTYRKFLRHLWRNDDTRWIVWWHNSEQRAAVESYREHVNKKLMPKDHVGGKCGPLTVTYKAEEDNQNVWDRKGFDKTTAGTPICMDDFTETHP